MERPRMKNRIVQQEHTYMRSTEANNRYERRENAHKVAPPCNRSRSDAGSVPKELGLLQGSKKKRQERDCSGSISGMRKSFYVTSDRTCILILSNYIYIFYFRSSIPPLVV